MGDLERRLIDLEQSRTDRDRRIEALEKDAAHREDAVHECTTWRAAHDGRIDELWRQQHEWNAATDRRLADGSARMGALERRLMYLWGASATVGVLLGALLTWFLVQ